MSDLLNRESIKKVQITLETFDKSIKVQILDETARTALDASKALNCEVGAIVKSLLLRTDDAYLMCLISGDKKCSLKKVKKITNKKDVCMANADAVKEQTGFTIGGVAPVGLKKKIKIMIDNQLKRFDILYAAAGHPNAVFKIDLNNLVKITNGMLKDISE